MQRLLERHRLLDTLAARQEGPNRSLLEDLQHRQNIAELHKHIRAMHAADVAYILEALPHEDRGDGLAAGARPITPVTCSSKCPKRSANRWSR